MSDRTLLAEWRPNRTTWLAWPSHPDEWLGDLDPPRRTVAKLAEAIADLDPTTGEPRGEHIDILVLDQAGEHSARRHLGQTPARYHHIPFGDIWLRDTGPTPVMTKRGLEAACFQWNGWGGKYLFEHDAELAERIASTMNLPIQRHPYILEGGAIDTDGQGTILTTRQCLLAANRSPGRTPAGEPEIEHRLAAALGVNRVIWLDSGLQNDHTDGHIDTLARFVAPARVVCMRASRTDDPTRATLDQIAHDLRRARDATGARLDVIEIPSPGRILGPDSDIMPASYMNFYIGNTTIVVPTYGSLHDQTAITVIGQLFPKRRTVGIDACAIMTGGGAFHCITRQIPARPVSPTSESSS